MAIRIRRGNQADFDANKLVSGELGLVLDRGELHFCYSPGNVKRLQTAEDLQNLLNASEEAYAALQQLVSDLTADPNELANILSNISNLQDGLTVLEGGLNDKIDKAEKGVTIATLDQDGKVPSEQLPEIASSADKINYDNTNSGLSATNTQDAMDELSAVKVNKTDIAQTDTVNDTTKIPSAAVTHALGQEIDEINNNLGDVSSQLAQIANEKVSVSDFNAKFGSIAGMFTFKGSDSWANISVKTGMEVNDCWYDTTNARYVAYNGTAWITDIGNINLGASSVGLQQFPRTIKEDIGEYVDVGVTASSTIYKVSGGNLITGTYSGTTGLTFPVTAGDMIKASFRTELTDAYYVVFGNASSQLISAQFLGTGIGITHVDEIIEVPTGATFVCILSKGTPPIASKLQYLSIATKEEVDAVKDGTSINNFAIKKKKLSFAVPTINLFDKDEILENTYVNGTNGKVEANTTWFLSDYIPASASTSYKFGIFDSTWNSTTSPYRAILNCFDSNKAFIGVASTTTSTETSYSGDAVRAKVFTTIANTAFVRLQVYMSVINYSEFLLCESSNYPTSYIEPYIIPSDNITGYATEEYVLNKNEELRTELEAEIQNKNEELRTELEAEIQNNSGTTIVNYNESYNYEWFNTNAVKRADHMLARLYNTSKAYKMLTTNEVSLFQPGDTYGHDATLCLHIGLGKLYCFYVANKVTRGDSAYDVNAFVRLQIMTGSSTGAVGSVLNTITVCKNGDTVGGKVITSGCGVPNAYLVGDILHMIWSAKCDDNIWYEMHCTYNCQTDTLGTPEICTMDSGLMSCQKIATHLGLTVNGQISINASIALYNGYYYACACSDDLFPNGAILRTLDFVNWEFVKEPVFSGITSSAKYEGAMGALGSDLYLALRQNDLDASMDINPIILAKMDANCNVIDYILIPSIPSRPSFFMRGTTELYLAFPTNNRLNTVLLKIDANLRDSIPMQDIPTGGNYVQVCPRTPNLQFVVRTAGSTGIRVSSMNGMQLDSVGVMNAFNTVMGL